MLKWLRKSWPEAILIAICVAYCAVWSALSFERLQYQCTYEQECQTNGGAPAQQPDGKSFWVRTTEDPIALYTAVLAVFTIILAGASIWQGIITWGALDLSRSEFIASHRPKIRLRHLRLEHFIREESIAISLRASNIGDGPATIVGIDIDLEVPGAIPRNPQNIIAGTDPISFAAGFLHKERVSAGGAAYVRIELPLVYENTWHDPNDMRGAVKISGKIVYSDDAGTRRETAFYRRCTGDPNRFWMVNWRNEAETRDLEYED